MISPIGLNLNNVRFKAQTEPAKQEYDKSPISKAGERATLFKATAWAGIAFGVRALWWLCDEGFLFDIISDTTKKVTKKNKKGFFSSKGPLTQAGLVAAGLVAFVGSAAALYTLYNTPKVMYEGKVNAFKKDKDMDVYIKNNAVQKDLYEEMNDKAKSADDEEKKVLSQQYLKLKAAQDGVPKFSNK